MENAGHDTLLRLQTMVWHHAILAYIDTVLKADKFNVRNYKCLLLCNTEKQMKLISHTGSYASLMFLLAFSVKTKTSPVTIKLSS